MLMLRIRRVGKRMMGQDLVWETEWGEVWGLKDWVCGLARGSR